MFLEEQQKVILPPKYYLDYFRYVLDFVSEKYTHILSETESLFIEKFKNLNEDAQCLFVRITIRKGIYFRVHTFNYAEIGSIGEACQILTKTGFLIPVQHYDEAIGADLLRIFTKGELYVQSRELVDVKIPKAIKRTELEELIIDHIEDGDIISCLGAQNEVVVQGFQEEWSIIRLLFFGNTYGDMSDFIIRDVGNAKFQQFDEEHFSPSFDSRKDLLAVWNMRNYRYEYKLLMELGSPEVIYEWIKSIDLYYYLSIEKSRSGTEKLINKAAYYLEQNQLVEKALEIYAFTDAVPSRERRVRVYKKMGKMDEATSLAQTIMENPQSAKEHYFASDFINREQARVKSTTQRQKEGITISIPEAHKNRVENGVVSYYKDRGYHAIHSENFIWKSLFGLTLWDIIFDPSHSSIHQPLQRRPSDLTRGSFYTKRKGKIDEHLNSFKSKRGFVQYVKNNYMRFDQMANPFVSWHEDLFETMQVLMQKLNLRQLKSVIREIAIDPTVRSSGFPDLFVWNDDEYHFYEVKSPTDQLSEKQLFWLEHFAQIKINAEIVLVQWN